MAAAAGAGATLLEIGLVLQGVGDVVAQIRQTSGEFEGLAGSARGANDQVAQLRAQLTSGASAGQFGSLAAQFGSIGLPAGQVNDMAHEFRERLFHDPVAISGFGRSVLPARLGGPQDETRELREAMQMLRSITSAEERLYEARRLGLEVLLPLADADDRHFDAMVAEGERRGAMVDEELRQLRANHTAQEQRLKDLQAETDMIHERIGLRLSNWWRDNITIPNQEGELFRQREEARLLGLGPQSVAGSGGNRHTQAVEENTKALATLKNELANSGRRGRAAIPAGLHGVTLEKALESGKLTMGAFVP